MTSSIASTTNPRAPHRNLILPDFSSGEKMRAPNLVEERILCTHSFETIEVEEVS
jgi:hypothetical protein